MGEDCWFFEVSTTIPKLVSGVSFERGQEKYFGLGTKAIREKLPTR